jgi:hypothetical protein
MSENKVLNPFKPADPRIPGVSPRADKTEDEPNVSENSEEHGPGLMAPPMPEPAGDPGRLKLLWVGIALATAIATGALLFRSTPGPAPTVNKIPSSTHIPELDDRITLTETHSGPIADGKLPLAPGRIAAAEELAKPWSSKRFNFRDPVTSKVVPATVVHLPGGTFWGFSLREPFGNCELEYVTNLNKLRSDYNFAAGYPMVADPCNKTVFDLTKYGNAPSGLVRGEIEQGPGWRPPIAIEIRTTNTEVIAVRMEQ